MDFRVWQYVGNDSWDFGIPVRGIIRDIIATVYFDGDRNPGWIWAANIEPNQLDRRTKGQCNYLREAVASAEEALGIKPQGQEM